MRPSRFDRIKRVENQFDAASLALGRLLQSLQKDSAILIGTDVEPQHIRDCRQELEFTYVVRLFAEFEAVLRNYWLRVRRLRVMPRTPAEVLMDRVAARQNVSLEVLRGAHDVRNYRNSLCLAARLDR